MFIDTSLGSIHSWMAVYYAVLTITGIVYLSIHGEIWLSAGIFAYHPLGTAIDQQLRYPSECMIMNDTCLLPGCPLLPPENVYDRIQFYPTGSLGIRLCGFFMVLSGLCCHILVEWVYLEQSFLWLRLRYNPLRWADYAISLSLGSIVCLRLAGDVSIVSWFGSIGCNIAMMYCAYLSEFGRVCCSCCEFDPLHKLPEKCRACRRLNTTYNEMFMSLVFGLILTFQLFVYPGRQYITSASTRYLLVMTFFMYFFLFITIFIENLSTRDKKPRILYSSTELTYILLMAVWRSMFVLIIWGGTF